MWGSDYPRRNGLWPDSHEDIMEVMGGIDADLRRRIINDNVRQLHRMNSRPYSSSTPAHSVVGARDISSMTACAGSMPSNSTLCV